MSLAKDTKMANRCGLDLKIYEYDDSFDATSATELAEIAFANEVSIELSSDVTWATGGKTHDKLVAFGNPYEGTLKISTQMVTGELLALIAGSNVSSTTNTVTFKNSTSAPTPYIIVGQTVWVDEDGNSYSETVTAHKAYPKKNYNVTYNGDGDPQSLEVTFELAANSDKEILTLTKAEEQQGA